LASTSIFLGDGYTHPSSIGHGLIEVPRELVFFVFFPPILVGKLNANPTYAVADGFVVFRRRKVHEGKGSGRFATWLSESNLALR
jgi:hypothetical protein